VAQALVRPGGAQGIEVRFEAALERGVHGIPFGTWRRAVLEDGDGEIHLLGEPSERLLDYRDGL
jgi:hypothetical protein